MRGQENRPHVPLDIVTGNSSYWLPVDDKYNKYHRFTEGEQGQEAIYNKKYMSPDGKHEVIICYDEIYVPDPYIVTDPINLGTYNYGANKIIHFFVDMIPYWLWGNSPSDTTTDWDRIVGRDYS